MQYVLADAGFDQQGLTMGGRSVVHPGGHRLCHPLVATVLPSFCLGKYQGKFLAIK
jgi:hypothetical protein